MLLWYNSLEQRLFKLSVAFMYSFFFGTVLLHIYRAVSVTAGKQALYD